MRKTRIGTLNGKKRRTGVGVAGQVGVRSTNLKKRSTNTRRKPQGGGKGFQELKATSSNAQDNCRGGSKNETVAAGQKRKEREHQPKGLTKKIKDVLNTEF